MSLKELEDISQKVDIIRKTLVEISEKILNNNISKNEFEIKKEM